MTSDGAPGERRGQRLLHERLVLGVEVAGGLVEDDDRRVLQQHPGDGQPLLLAARQAVAPLADDRVVALGQAGDHVVDLGGPAGRLQLGVGGVRPGVAEVGADRVVEQVRVLADHADGRAQAVLGEVAHVVAVDPHRPGGHVVEPGDRATPAWSCPRPTGRRGRRSGRLDHAGRCPRRTGRWRSSQRGARCRPRATAARPRRPPGSGTTRRRARSGPRADSSSTAPGRSSIGLGSVEHLEHPVEGHERRHHVDAGVGQAGERRVDAGHVGAQATSVPRVMVPEITSWPPSQ